MTPVDTLAGSIGRGLLAGFGVTASSAGLPPRLTATRTGSPATSPRSWSRAAWGVD